jgi:DNA polymerase-3 subunit beta
MMKLNIERETLLEPLQMVIGVVERRQTMPILANVLLATEGAQLSVIATDTEIELIAQVTLSESLPHSAELTLPGRKLLDIFRTLPDNAQIDMQQDQARVLIRSSGSRFTLATLPAAAFPRFETTTPRLTQTLSSKELSTLLQRSAFSMAEEDIRHYLNGMLIDLNNNKIRTVATDGHRFSMNAQTIDTQDKNAQVILPRKSVLELLRLLKHRNAEEVILEIGENHVRVNHPTFTFTSRLIDGRFPSYERVLPKEKGNCITLDRETLKSALMRVFILSNEQLRVVRFQLRPNFLHILTNNPEQEEAEEILSVDYTGEELEISFTLPYVLDVLNTITTNTVRLAFAEGNSRLLIEEPENDAESMFLIMPLKL